MYLKESCFPDCWKVSLVIPVFKNVGKRSNAKNYSPVSLLSVVSKVFEKLANNRIINHLKKCDLFPFFQYGFRSSWSTAEQLCLIELLGLLTGLGLQGIIQKKSVSSSWMLLCLMIFFQNFILILKCQKWSLNRGTLPNELLFYSSKCLFLFFWMLHYDSRLFLGLFEL